MNKKILIGLDLGPNSIGWTVIKKILDEANHVIKTTIENIGSRIIPMDATMLSNFENGDVVSQTANRTKARGVRRLRERFLLRRERLHRVLKIIGFLPEHYQRQIGWDKINDKKHYGTFLENKELKIAWEQVGEKEYKFIFEESFNEMVDDFKKTQPILFSKTKNGKDRKIPYDWTIYYLRKKALTQKISKYELAWILLNFNQKRGYYQLRDEEEEDNSKIVEYKLLKVIKVETTNQKRGDNLWYNIYLENNLIYRRASKTPLEWEGKIKEFIITTELNEDGTIKKDKDGKEKRSFRAPKEDDWALIKTKTEQDINSAHKTVGEYIYDTLLQKPNQKVKGKLISVIERKYYKEELKRILEKQKEFHKELNDVELYKNCINELYTNNEAYRNSIANRNFTYLLLDDVLFYQRPLKTKKSLISNCSYEKHVYKDTQTGELKYSPIKCIAKSNPLFQEFRLWQFISNLDIYQKEKIVWQPNGERKVILDYNVTDEFLKTEEDYTKLFEWLNDKKEIDQTTLLSYFIEQTYKIKFTKKAKDKKKLIEEEIDKYSWNYVPEKIYPCNRTRNAILSKLIKEEKQHLTKELEMLIWHTLYSITTKEEIDKAFSLNKNNKKHTVYLELKKYFSEESINKIKHIKLEEKDYGSYSEKAIKKLLPLMRTGKYWSEEKIDNNTKERINKIINGEYDEQISSRVREKSINLNKIEDFKCLPLWLACYIVYNRHSEVKDINKWKSPEDINIYLTTFKQHSLHNPIVEQVVMDTLRVVRDIWKQYGQIDEIHIELGRDLKNNNESRKKTALMNLENEKTNLRIKTLLQGFFNEGKVEEVKPYSPSQQELFKIYEDGVLGRKYNLKASDTFKHSKANITYNKGIDSNIIDIINKQNPTQSECNKYRLWLEQKYQSPYTGAIIPLSKLFTSAYQIEHIIPKARYFDDSLSNKVICESEVNRLKGEMLGHEFIINHHGEKVNLGDKKTVTILSIDEYEKLVDNNYSNNKTKKEKLLLDDIPDKFNERQKNDMRYISKLVMELLSNIVREEDTEGNEEQEAISKNVIPCSGAITDRLKKDWGINDKWNELILPRFKRMNDIMGTNQFTALNTQGKLIPAMPLELEEGFRKKRIDHRHHAMDALIIACTDRNIINYLNNVNAKSPVERKDLRAKICEKKEDENWNYNWVIKKPWDTFPQDALNALNNIIISFKQNNRVLTKTTNKYESYKDEKGNIRLDNNGKPKKGIVSQIHGDHLAIRKPLHKGTVSGEVQLKTIVNMITLKDAIIKAENIVDDNLRNIVLHLKRLNKTENEIFTYIKENKSIDELKLDNVIYEKGTVEVYCKTNLKDRYFATRAKIDNSFDIKKIEKITDISIQNIIRRHLKNCDNNIEFAFSADGIEEMNKNIKQLNNNKYHKPIYSVRVFEKANKFSVGQEGNKSSKYVEAEKGTNLFFAVYKTKNIDKTTGEEIYARTYDTIPLNVVIERLKQGLTSVPESNYKGEKLLFSLSPCDLVYLPTQDEIENKHLKEQLNKNRIYKFIDSSGTTANFIPHTVANLIYSVKKGETKITNNNNVVNEYGIGSSQSKNQKSITGEMIKDICIPLKVNRLGNITYIGSEFL
jgi:CRISPR-associated endonuclease Csn1